MKRALIVGIDQYSDNPLSGCENDARDISRLLERNGDGSPNFAVRLLSSENEMIGSAKLTDAVEELFASEADTAVFYFAGHGVIHPETNAGHIVSQDGRRGAWGMSLSEILALANGAYPRIRSTVIILDSCHSGYAGEVAGLGRNEASVIGNGVTILTATHREGLAAESGGRGQWHFLKPGSSCKSARWRRAESRAAVTLQLLSPLSSLEDQP